MIRRIITTVGTSVIGKFNEQSTSLSSKFRQLENAPLTEWEARSTTIEKLKTALLKFLQQDQGKASAEVKSLDKITAQYPNDDIEVYLLATDTILSRMVAEVVKGYYDKKYIVHFSPDEYIIKGLQVKNFAELDENGFANLIQTISKIKYRQQRNIEYEYILNVTGGYKATIPILTILGQLLNMPLNYIYENSDELIEIGQLPISINWEEAEELTPYLIPKYFETGYFDNNTAPQITQKMNKYGLIRKENGKHKITPWGFIFKNYVDVNLPISYSQTISHIVEYKIYEMYITNPLKLEGIEYANIIRSHDVYKPDGSPKGEIDLLMNEQTNPKNYITVEVKSIGKITTTDKRFDSYKGAKKQFEDRQLIPITQEKGCPPKEAHYIIFQMFDGTNENDQDFIKRLKELKDVAKGISPNIKFRAFLYNIGDPNNPFIYRDLLREKTNFSDHLQEIQIN